MMEGESRVSHPDSSCFHFSTSKCLKRQRSSLLGVCMKYGALDGLTMEDKKKSCGSILMFWNCSENCDGIVWVQYDSRSKWLFVQFDFIFNCEIKTKHAVMKASFLTKYLSIYFKLAPCFSFYR